MKPSLLSAVRSLHQNEPAEALAAANKFIAQHTGDFWGYYVAALACGYLNDIKEFSKFVEKAGNLDYYSPLLSYLRGYLALREGNQEQAIFEYTSVASAKDGWLAIELLARMKKQEPLVDLARSGNFGDFVFLPEIDEQHKSDHKSRDFSSLVRRARTFLKTRRLFALVIVSLSIILVLTSLSIIAFRIFSVSHTKNFAELPNLEIQSTASLVNSGSDVLRRYNSRDQLIEDFRLARDHLSHGRVNEGIYLLQSISHSNADFQSREKARLLLSMMPEPDFETFQNTLTPEDLLRENALRHGSFILWEGALLRDSRDEHGRRLQLSVKVDEKEFVIEAYQNFVDGNSSPENIRDFFRARKIAQGETKEKVVIYGQFRGLIGDAQRPYIEVLRLWK